MSYTRLTWVESETPLSAQNMNNIEDGIEELQAQKVDKTSGKGLSTNDYTTAEKTKLAGIAAGAEVNPGDFVGANASAAGVHGLVPAPTSTDFMTKKLLCADGSWRDLTFRDTNSNGILQSIGTANDALAFNLRDAATTRSGLMSAADKTKLNGIESGAMKIWYGTCSDKCTVLNKTVVCSGFTLSAGTFIAVAFTNTEIVSQTGTTGFSLNVNSTGAKTIYYRNTTMKQDDYPQYFKGGRLLLFRYDGEHYVLVGDPTV